MKIVFFLVVLANVTLFFWEYKRSIANDAGKPYELVDLPEREAIVLAGEIEQKPSPGAAGIRQDHSGRAAENSAASMNRSESGGQGSDSAPAAVETTPEPDVEETSVRCYQAGPFDDHEYESYWRNRLHEAGTRSKFVSRQEKSVSDYVVYFPATESMAEYEANLQRLREIGLKQYWIKRTGEEKGQILLGIFSQENRALKMQGQLKRKGINADVRARYQNKVNRYAIIQAAEHDQSSLDELFKAYPAVPVKLLAGASENCRLDARPSVGAQASKPAGRSGALTASETGSPPNADADSPAPVLKNNVPSEKKEASNDLDGMRACYRIGPFTDDRQLQDASRLLSDESFEVRPVAVDDRTVSDYLVFYPGGKTPEQAEEHVRMLKSRGVNDVWLIRSGEDHGKISLGVFSKEQRAALMKSQLKAMGIKVEIKPRYKNRRVNYLVVDGGKRADERVKRFAADHPGLSAMTSQKCSEAADAD